MKELPHATPPEQSKDYTLEHPENPVLDLIKITHENQKLLKLLVIDQAELLETEKRMEGSARIQRWGSIVKSILVAAFFVWSIFATFQFITSFTENIKESMTPSIELPGGLNTSDLDEGTLKSLLNSFIGE